MLGSAFIVSGDVSHTMTLIYIGTAIIRRHSWNYTNVPNYSALREVTTRPTARLVGAVTTQPLGGQPPFDSPSTRVATRSTRMSAAVIHVTIVHN